jgi:hypothetical protein
VVGIPHQTDDFVPVTTQQLRQPQRDLPVSTRNDDSHT